MPLPLSGLLVVSLEQAVAAPMCTCRLADAGARVIKVERPEGDFARYYDKLAVPREAMAAANLAATTSEPGSCVPSLCRLGAVPLPNQTPACRGLVT
jgi:CoA-transferase family III